MSERADSTAKGAYRGRLAPSPTGRAHFGTARTALIAWLAARSAGGTLVLRLEDLDGPRVVQGATEAILSDLRWLGLDWDEGPDVGGAFGPYLQSQRAERYAGALAVLERQGLLFECSCTRRELVSLASAPHGELGPVYPGTCRESPMHPERPRALRFRMGESGAGFVDRVHGRVPASPADDFVVRRSDGLFAYQLAVVVDDIAMRIGEVVRGDDLLSSTARQIALYRALGAEPPRFAHVSLVLGADGARLAKRHGAIAIADFRAAGETPESVVGRIGASLGLCEPGARRRPRDLIDGFSFDRMPQRPFQLD